MDLTIRRAEPSDRDHLRFTIADGTDVTEDILKFFDDPTVTTFVAQNGDAVVGQVMTDDMPFVDRPDANDARRIVRLFFLYVDPSHRQCGIGSALMARVETEAGDAEAVTLLVEDSLLDVRKMYERRGYVTYAEAEGGRGTKCVAMWLQLPNTKPCS